MILEDVISEAHSATDEAWHWPKPGCSTSSMEFNKLRVEVAVQYTVVICANTGSRLSMQSLLSHKASLA